MIQATFDKHPGCVVGGATLPLSCHTGGREARPEGQNVKSTSNHVPESAQTRQRSAAISIGVVAALAVLFVLAAGSASSEPTGPDLRPDECESGLITLAQPLHDPAHRELATPDEQASQWLSNKMGDRRYQDVNMRATLKGQNRHDIKLTGRNGQAKALLSFSLQAQGWRLEQLLECQP